MLTQLLSRVRSEVSLRTCIIVATAPVVAFFLYGVEPFYVQNGVDPFIYAGYTFEPSDLITRYGYSYYSVRFGLLLPSEIFVRLFGVAGGYLILRWLLVVVAIGCLVVWCQRLGAPLLSWLAGALFLVNPVVWRSVMTVYSDSIGVPCLAAAYALLLLDASPRRRVVACLTAGALMGLTVNANLFLALPIGASLPVWLAVRVWVVRKHATFEAIAAASGIVLVTLIGAVVYWIRYGSPNIFAPSIDAARTLQSSTSLERAPTREWLNFRPYLFLPAASIMCLGITLAVRRIKPVWYEIAAVGMMTVVGIIYLYQEFISEGYLLEIYFYTSYFIGLNVILVVLAARRIMECFVIRWWTIAIPTGLVVIYPFIWRLVRDGVQVWTVPGLPVFIGVVAVLALLRNHAWACIVSCTFLSVSPLIATLSSPHHVPLAVGQPYRREPHYDTSLFNQNYRYLHAYELAHDFVEFAPDWQSSPGTIVFWYPFDDEMANLMGSTFLWLRTTLTVTPPGLPVLDSTVASHLAGRTPRYLILVASTKRDVDEALVAVRAVVEPTAVERRKLSQSGIDIYLARLALNPDFCDQDSAGRETYYSGLPDCA